MSVSFLAVCQPSTILVTTTVYICSLYCGHHTYFGVDLASSVISSSFYLLVNNVDVDKNCHKPIFSGLHCCWPAVKAKLFISRALIIIVTKLLVEGYVRNNHKINRGKLFRVCFNARAS